ncbi:MAG TPA: AmmeMemoRadiSam system protein B [Anaerolineae bacterium]|nr:AmmeMemoRadiSam system protein B [Anaerolineae bacterium]
MTLPNTKPFPKLRPVDARPFQRGDQLLIALRDPLGLTEKTLFIPQQLGPLLAFIDGTRDARSLSAAIAVRFGMSVSPSEIEQILTAFDQALLLDNDRSAEALVQALGEYRQASHREPALAGATYPENPDELRGLLQGYLDAMDDHPVFDEVRGLISPHIDYARGGPVYAQVWGSAEEYIRAADLAVIVGTDHSSPEGRVTLTRQHYATPFGVLPTEQEVVENIAGAIGEEEAFAQELYHRGEHSIELAATWLHYMRDEQPCELIPILCGTFEHFFGEETDAEKDLLVDQLTEALRSSLSDRNAIVVAAGDLSHVGPAFGGYPLDLVGRARLEAADKELLEQVCSGNTDEFIEAIRSVKDVNNVCGVAPIYLTMRALSPVTGTQVAYDRCPADEQGTSLVSICGVVFH